MPIRLRLAFVIMVATALAASLGGWIFVATLGDRLHRSLVSELTARADAVSQQLQLEAPAASPTSGGMPDLSDSQSVTLVLDRNGTPVASSGIDQGAILLTRAQQTAANRGTVVQEQLLPGARTPTLILARPASDGKPYIVVVGASLATVDNAVGQVRNVIIIGGILAVFLAGLATWLLAGAALSPVERMRRQAAEMTGMDDSSSLEVPETRDEIAALASTFNDLLARIHAGLQLQRSFVAAAGHELRTPLAILTTELELAGNPGRSRDELVAAVAGAAEETERLVHLAEDLLVLAQSDDASDFVRLTDVDMAALLGTIVSNQQSRCRFEGVTIDLAGPTTLPVKADASRIRQAIDNVLDNALRFAPRNSVVSVILQRDGDDAMVEIDDKGPGIDPDFLPRAFDRFARPDDARGRDGGGAGLGLSIVQSIVLAHRGTVEIRRRSTRGTSVRIRIPAESVIPVVTPAEAGDPGRRAGVPVASPTPDVPVD